MGMAALGLAIMTGPTTARQVPGVPGDPSPRVRPTPRSWPGGRSTRRSPAPIVFNPTPGVVVPKPPALDRDRGAPAGPEAGGGGRPVDPRLLGLGRRAGRLHLGQRGLARHPAGPAVGPRLLEPGRRRLPLDLRLLGAPRRPTASSTTCPRRRRAWRTARTRPSRAPTTPGSPARGSGTGPIRLAAGLLGPGQPRLGLDPGSYVPTPSGYLYNDGYWDYSLPRGAWPSPRSPSARRPSPRPTYAYSPENVLPVAGLLSSLFVRPNYGHYYFGDYYGRRLARAGVGLRPLVRAPAGPARV